MGQDRRRYPRVGVALDASVEAAGIQWRRKTVDLSPYGVKVAMPVKLRPEMSVAVRLPLPDGRSPLSLAGRVVRTDPDGIAISFVGLQALAFARLKEFVDGLLVSLSNGAARPDLSVTPLSDRRRAPRAEAELDINVNAETSHDWQSKTINLSTIGVKVAMPPTASQPPWGTGVELRLSTPNGQPPIAATALVWRREPNSLALLFVGLGNELRERLRTLVDSLRA